MLQMIQNAGKFGGLQGEDPHAHLTSFVDICSAFSILGVTPEELRLYLFPYTLRDEARRWAQSLEPDEINAWDQLVERFMNRFFSSAVNPRRRGDVLNFEQKGYETLSTAWVRFRQLVKSCPHIGIPDCIMMENFYNGLDQPTQAVVDASVAEGLMDKSYMEVKSILDRISRDSDEWLDTEFEERSLEQERVEGAIVPVDTMSTLVDQVTIMTSLLQTMANQQRHLSQGSTQANVLTHMAAMNCIQCGEGHSVEVYSWNQQSVYPIYNEPFGNTYNPGWRNHPTFSWDRNHNQGSQSNHQNNYQGIRGNPPASLIRIIAQNKTIGTLPSSSGALGPRGKEQCQAVTLRSGKTTVPVSPIPDAITRPVDLTINDDQSTINDRTTGLEVSTSTRDESQQELNSKSTQPPVTRTQQAQDLNEQPIEQEVWRDPPTFPSRLKKKDHSKQFQRFLDVLRQLHINIPLIEALEQMPSCVKFLKDILANKRKIRENETIALIYECRRALIDVQKGELTIRVDDQQVKFNVLNALKYPSDMENCQYVEEL
ncbi:uncharacterized protein LOC120084813 [Benincasa hispida]|uniref:uncharacterized protein LOC120084813 n=1 Tax=Benincasa hispida TaxID=102211 RepID=UPI00190135F9|nr:uncharacterized protein LOC120084813 [Benincasa hispida]